MKAYIKSKFYIKSGRFDVEPNSPTSSKIGVQQCKNNVQQCTRRDCALKQREIEGTRRLVTSHGFQAVCRHTHAQFKLLNRQIAKQTGASEPLGGATTAQGANKEPSPTPAALAERRRGGKNWTKDK
jgi:hypothetical protein